MAQIFKKKVLVFFSLAKTENFVVQQVFQNSFSFFSQIKKKLIKKSKCQKQRKTLTKKISYGAIPYETTIPCPESKRLPPGKKKKLFEILGIS